MNIFFLSMCWAALALFAGIPSTSAVAAPAPIGLDVNGQEYVLASNNGWQVSGTETGPARMVAMFLKRRTGATDAQGRQDEAYIWAQRCTDAVQRLTFRRVYFLPGPPKTFSADIETTNIVHEQSIPSVRVFINGRLAINATGRRTQIALTDKKYPQLFRYGDNTVVIHVVKRAKSGFVGRCRAGGNPPQPLGLRFRFKGSFEADLALPARIPPRQGDYFRISRAGLPATFTLDTWLHSRLRHLGPSGAYFATLSVTVESSRFSKISVHSLDTSGPEVRGCRITPFGPIKHHIECQLERWDRGRRPGITFDVEVDLSVMGESDVRGVVFLSDIRSPTSDPNPTNDLEHWTAYLCGPTATDPNCP